MTQTALVIGGTHGAGLAAAVAFARRGARVVIAHRAGDPIDADLRARLAEAADACTPAAPLPVVVECAAGADATLLRTLRRAHGILTIDAIVGTPPAIQRTAWPLVDTVRAARRELGAFPRYVVALSADGDAVAALCSDPSDTPR